MRPAPTLPRAPLPDQGQRFLVALLAAEGCPHFHVGAGATLRLAVPLEATQRAAEGRTVYVAGYHVAAWTDVPDAPSAVPWMHAPGICGDAELRTAHFGYSARVRHDAPRYFWFESPQALWALPSEAARPKLSELLYVEITGARDAHWTYALDCFAPPY